MLDCVEHGNFVNIQDLIKAIGNVDGLTEYDIFDEIRGDSGDGAYVYFDEFGLFESLFDSAGYPNDSFDEITSAELLNKFNPESSYDKVNYRLLEMIIKGDLPKEFRVLVSW